MKYCVHVKEYYNDDDDDGSKFKKVLLPSSSGCEQAFFFNSYVREHPVDSIKDVPFMSFIPTVLN